MRNEKEQQAFDPAEGLPTLFAALDSILAGDDERVEKSQNCLLESDAVLAFVGEIFGFVPLEPGFDHYSRVITFW